MIPVNARQQGGAVIMTIPADLVKLFDIKSGDSLNVDVIPGGFVTRPATIAAPRRYTIGELLKGVDRKTMAALNAETAWAREGSPVGRELA
jgi:antitoxin ChpS